MTPCLLLVATVFVLNAAAADGGEQHGLHKLDRELQVIKGEAVDIGQTLLELEEAVRYPRDLQLIIFVSLGREVDFKPKTVQLRLDGDVVAEQNYNSEDVVNLRNRGVHRLYTGRVPYGKHTLLASLEGQSETGERYRRQVSSAFLKGPGPTYVELGIGAAGKNGEPQLILQTW